MFIKHFLKYLLLLMVAAPAVYAQGSRTAEVKRIDSYVKQLNAYSKRSKKPHVIFADTSLDEKPKWKRFSSEDALEKFRNSVNETYTIFYVWQRNGKIVMANATLFSESGDWAQYDFHFFRPDGSLAKMESELRSFYGDMIVLRNFYYDSRGKLLKKRTRYRDLRSKKPIKQPEEAKEPLFNDIDIYKSARKLPFIHLTRKK